MASVKEYIQSVVNAIGEVNPKAGGTAINPTETYDKIYFNTSLSVDESNSILNNINFTLRIPASSVGLANAEYVNFYPILFNASTNVGLFVQKLEKSGNDDLITIELLNVSTFSNVYRFFDNTNGFKEDIINPYEYSYGNSPTITFNGITYNVGQQNELLKGLIYAKTNTINAQDVPNKIRELKVEVDNATPIKPTNSYNKILLNNKISNTQVSEILSKLTYTNGKYYVFYSENGANNFSLTISQYPYGYDIEYSYRANGSGSGAVLYNDTAWNTYLDPYKKGEITFPITFTGVDTYNDVSVGQQNDLLKELFYVKGSKQLLGSYDGSAVEVTEAGVVDIGAMLDEGKLPLEVNVNVASSGGSGGGEDMLQTLVNNKKSCANLFEKYEGDNVDFIKKLDTSKAENMQEMFASSSNLTSVPLLDTSNVTNMIRIFNYCGSLLSVPQFNTSNVTKMAYAFNSCSSLTEIPQLDTSKVENMANTFAGCRNLVTIPKLDLASATNVNSLFESCNQLTNLIVLNIKLNLTIGSGGSGYWDYGHLLTLDSLINTCKELINVGSARTLTMGTINLNKIANTYVKFVDSSQTTIANNTKGEVEVCESTDAGAMLLSDYATLKNWTLA